MSKQSQTIVFSDPQPYMALDPLSVLGIFIVFSYAYDLVNRMNGTKSLMKSYQLVNVLQAIQGHSNSLTPS